MPRLSRPTRARLAFVTLCVVLGLLTSVGVAWGIAWRHGPIVGEDWSTTPPLEFLTTPGRFEYGDGPHEAVAPLPCKPVKDIAPHLPVQALRDYGDGHLVVWYVYRSELDGVFLNFVSAGGGSPDPIDIEVFDHYTSDAVSRRAIRRHTPLLGGPEALLLDFSIVLIGWPFACLGYEDAFTARDASQRREVNPEYWSGGPPVTDLDPFYGALVLGRFDYGFRHVLPLAPLWPGLLANTAIYAGAWGVLIGGPILLRRTLRRRRGGCSACGYSRDGLTKATTCPECGHTPSPMPTATTPSGPPPP